MSKELQRAVAAACSLAADLADGGELYLRKPGGKEMVLVELSASQAKLLRLACNGKREPKPKPASPPPTEDGERDRLVARINELTDGLRPFHLYKVGSLRDLADELEADPYFTGPFRGQKVWACAVDLGDHRTVKKHQDRRRRKNAPKS